MWEKNTVPGWKFTIVYEQANRLAADGTDEAGAEGEAVAQPEAGEADNGVHAMNQTEETDNGAHAMDQNDAAADEAFDSG